MQKILSLLVVLAAVGCQVKDSTWADADRWSMADSVQYGADLFYIVSTNVWTATDSAGREIYNATLTAEDCAAIDKEAEFIKRTMGDSLNVFSPYYRQFTMSAILLPTDSFQTAFDTAKADIRAAFDYYVKTLNPTRPYVLVGFSQGAMIIPTLLREMSAEAYQRCRGAYMLGYRLTAADLQDSRIEAATSATEGKVVSFNTTVRNEDAWPFVSADAATCINPLNWRTDATPATLYYQQDTLTVSVDTVSHLLLCNADRERYAVPGALFGPGCLHLGDLLFYTKAIRENIRTRLNTQ